MTNYISLKKNVQVKSEFNISALVVWADDLIFLLENEYLTVCTYIHTYVGMYLCMFMVRTISFE